MVYKSVGGLVRPNRIQYIDELRVWTQTPIIDGNFWSIEIGPKVILISDIDGCQGELTIPVSFRLPSRQYIVC